MPAPVTVEVKGDAKSQYCPDTCRKNVGESCGESNLDVQTVTGIAEGVPTQFWITKSGDPLDMFKQYNEDASSALVLSCSFGDSEDSFDEDGGSRLETELKKAGVAGKTILFASGDSGVWKGNQIRHKKFSVGYPVSSVYVTAVGGSQFMPTSTDHGGDRIGTEVAVQGGPDGNDKWITAGWSGGGISNMFTAPDYQAQSVSDWYDAAEAAGTLPAASKWANKKNRGYPDLSALAGVPGDGGPTKTGKCKGECASYLLRQAGYWVFGQGTSASCPAVAAMVAMINEHRLAAGSPPMGAINTFLYQHSNAFDDITLGDNFVYDASKGYGGFKAAVGWDPVTGLGAPNVAALTQAAMGAVRSSIVV
jgi:tripeptidyl-peptidase-1